MDQLGWRSRPTSSRAFAAFGEGGLAPIDASRNGVWITDDLGNSWTEISFGVSLFAGEPVTDVVPIDNQIVLAATYGGYGPAGHGGIYRGVQSGSTWTWTKALSQHR